MSTLVRVVLDLTQREADELAMAQVIPQWGRGMGGYALDLESAAIKLRAAIDAATTAASER